MGIGGLLMDTNTLEQIKDFVFLLLALKWIGIIIIIVVFIKLIYKVLK